MVERSDWSAAIPRNTKLDTALRERLADAWLADALLEHGSVAAFARFTLQLLSLGAPPELVVASQAASLDEIEHAKLCFALAARYADRSLGPGTIDITGAVEPVSLVELALATFHEGCVGETLGALLASEQLREARDPSVRAALERIAEDEARHAELAWRVVQWAIACGGAPVRRAIARALEELPTSAPGGTTPDTVAAPADRGVWRAHGRLTGAELANLRFRSLFEVIAPCAAALLAQERSPAQALVA